MNEKELKRMISDLCRRSLKMKWYEGSKYKLSNLCPFCENSGFYMCCNDCMECLCPKEICESHAKKGFISKLLNQYGKRALVKDIDKEDLNKIRNLFKKYIID